MPRPCAAAHPPSPATCRLCHWCADPSPAGTFHRRLWGEPEPGEPAFRPPDLLPGLPDPIPEPPRSAADRRWAHDPAVVRRHREAFAGLARGSLPRPGPRAGAGVVLVGGGKFWAGNVLAVRMLRDAGCTLPVQVWHGGAEEPARPADLAGLGPVEVRDLAAVRPVPRTYRGWACKTVALLASGWERVFYHDADAYCVADPTPLLDRLSAAEPFLYWEDHPSGWENLRWAAWGFPDTGVPPVQGGQYAVHLTHFWREFVLAYWVDQHCDFSYAHQYGDQDSWRLALAATGRPAGCLGKADWGGIAYTCRLGGTPLAVHRCHAKMFLPEDEVPGNPWTVPRRSDALPAEDRVWAHWEALVNGRPAAEVFGRVYAAGRWGPNQSSGSGSTPAEAAPYLDLVNGLIRVGGWRRVVDLGCGDGFINARLAAPEVVGVDCHAPHVGRLRRERPDREWHVLDLDRDRERLPAGDAALLKDVLHHWPNRLVRDWLAWARACGKWKWVVCTQDRGQTADGQDCPLGGYRALDPTLDPLRGLRLVPVGEYLGKGVLLLPAAGG